MLWVSRVLQLVGLSCLLERVRIPIKISVRENRPLAEVLPEKSRDSEIREQHFISPIALQGVINEAAGIACGGGSNNSSRPVGSLINPGVATPTKATRAKAS